MKKLIPLLIIITLAFGAVSATSFPAPTAPAPAGNIVPVHTGTQQTKNGNLSVDNFIARAIADFRQQIYINNTNLGKTTEGEKGNLKGSSIATAENTNIVLFGGVIEGNDPATTDDDDIYNTSVIGTDIITAQNFLQSWNVSHDATIAQKRDLCADADGNVVFCKVAITEVDVCANIQGAQTNPPTGMVRDGENCIWFVPPFVPVVTTISGITTGLRPVMGGTIDDHLGCAVQLNQPTTIAFNVLLRYTYTPSNGGRNETGECSLSLQVGEDYKENDPFPVSDTGMVIQRSCVVETDPAGIVIPNTLKC